MGGGTGIDASHITLLIATVAFVGGHLFLSSGPVRRRLAGLIGEAAFRGLYSILVAAALVWMIDSYRFALDTRLWTVGIYGPPMLVSFALWSGAHLLVRGDVAGLIFFGGFFVLATLGMVHIDARRRASAHGAAAAGWAAFEAATSRIPLLAVIQGRARPAAGTRPGAARRRDRAVHRAAVRARAGDRPLPHAALSRDGAFSPSPRLSPSVPDASRGA